MIFHYSYTVIYRVSLINIRESKQHSVFIKMLLTSDLIVVVIVY